MSEAGLKQLGRYRLLAELGRGAMGVVYKAEDPLLNRTVAIKTIILMEDPAVRADFEARFFQEAKAAGGLNHPNLITIHDVGREGDVAYMAMELLEGTELRELMRRGRLPLPFALEIVAQAADGLSYAHEHGVVHRDIKPANIMVVRDRVAKIMDFGIARVRVSDVKTQSGAILGSPKYLSPEQVAGQRVDRRSDIFSLGVVLHELAAGESPFTASTVAQLMHQISTAAPPPPSAANPAVPAMLDLIVARALEKQPDARYQNAAELAADLRACLAELGGQQVARPETGEATARPEAGVPVVATVDVELEGTRRDANEDPPIAQAAITLTLSGQGPYLSLSRRFDSSDAYRRLGGRAPLSITAAAPAGSVSRPPAQGWGARFQAWLDSGWLVVAEALILVVLLACLIAYYD